MNFLKDLLQLRSSLEDISLKKFCGRLAVVVSEM